MDEELARLTGATDADFQEAVHWWMSLRERGPECRASVAFERWLTHSSGHRRAYARIEALWEMVRRTSFEAPAAVEFYLPRSDETGT